MPRTFALLFAVAALFAAGCAAPALDDLVALEQFRRYPLRSAKPQVVIWNHSNGSSGVVSFGPTAHRACGTALLEKRDGRWTVTWRKLAYYA